MTNRPQLSDDDPVIGFSGEYDAPEADVDAVGSASAYGGRRATPVIEPYYGDDDLDPYYDEYAHESPTQSPWFYAFLFAAAIIGAVVVFAIVRSVDTGGDDETPTAIVAQVLQLQLVSPRNGDRIVAGEEVTFAANVAASRPIDKIELVVDDEVFAVGTASAAQTQPQAAGTTPTAVSTARLYDGVVRAKFIERGEHKVLLRVTSGELSRDTEAIRVIVVEAPQDPRVNARVIATTSIHTGPGESYPQVGQLQPGAEVRIAARTRDEQWLLLDDETTGDRWIRRNAVEEDSTLASVPIRDVTQTVPSATPTPNPEATPTPAVSGEPDFVPVDARFVGSALRVSILNQGGDFSGPLVVEASLSSGSLISSQLVFDLTLRAGRAATVDFQVAGPVPTRADVTIRVDPGNAVFEASEDNNSATFPGISAPSDPPELVISNVGVNGSTVTVVVTNLGGALPSSEITVRLTVGGSQSASSAVAAMDTDDQLTFTLAAGGTGTGTVQVLIDGATAASSAVEVSPEVPTETATPEETESPTETSTATASATEGEA